MSESGYDLYKVTFLGEIAWVMPVEQADLAQGKRDYALLRRPEDLEGKDALISVLDSGMLLYRILKQYNPEFGKLEFDED